jgi:metallo-beta-lactamase family protein
MKLGFHGAAGDVTGSCHLVECAGKRILIDCGMRQGSRELQDENAEPFGFDAAAIDFVLLTHAHLDHTGRIPLLYKRGFRGEVISTRATFDLARLVVLDVAHLHEEAAGPNAHASTKANRQPAKPPLFTLVDATNSLGLFGRTATYRQMMEVAPGVRATFYDAGHILGSASILLELNEPGWTGTLLFSGDIGNGDRPLLRSPETPKTANFVVMESTYGDRLHKPMDASVSEFYAAVATAIATGGKVLIPTFALDRAQEILYFLRQGIEDNKLPPALPIFLDSPMAVSATEIYRQHPESYNANCGDLLAKGTDPFQSAGLKLVRDRLDSMKINDLQGGAVIMAGSGMCTGGRILHHLRHNLSKAETSVIFVGYAAAGTLARRIIDGARHVNVLGDDMPVRARIHTINGFSAHADQKELIDWQHSVAGKQRTFVVHGEPPVMAELARHLDQPVTIPALHQSFDLETGSA